MRAGGGGGNLLKDNQLRSKLARNFAHFSTVFFTFSLVFSNNLFAQKNLNINGSKGLYVGNALVVQAMGDVNINATGVMSFQNGGTPDFRLKGDFTNNASGTYTYGTEKIRFNGTALQSADFGGAGNTNVFSIHTDNSQNVKITRNVNIASDVLYDVGHVLSTNSAYITLKEGATASNAKATAHNVGPIAKKLDAVFFSSFVFPTGDSLSYNPLTLEPEAGVDAKNPTSTTFLVDYHFIPPPNPNDLADGLEQVSEVEYWDVTRLEGNKNATLGMIWDEDSKIIIPDSLVVAFWDDTNWRAAGKNNLTGNDNNGSITSNMIDEFWSTSNKVTFGTKSVIAVLPVELIKFTATKNNNQVDVVWVTGMEINNDYFVLERSQDGINFFPIKTIKGAGNSSQTIHYSHIDNQPLLGVSYYRLHQVDFDGVKTYSSIQYVNFEGLDIVKVYPNPSQGHFNVQVNSTLEGVLTLTIYDALGKIVAQENITVKKGYTVLNQYINVATGRYFITTQLNNGQYYDYNYILIGR